MRIAFYSTMLGLPWGGSEELWARAAKVLLERGHQVTVNYKRRRHPVPRLEELRQLGAEVRWRRGLHVGRQLKKLLGALRIGRQPCLKWLKSSRPDLVVISAGYHLDDVSVAHTCRSLAIPYAILVQAASPHQWIESYRFEGHRSAFAGAQRCFFVSHQNREILESNLALDLSDAEIVDNPFQVSANAAPSWPADQKLWKLACVARIDFKSKSQDLLLRVMRQPKWRSRPVQVCLWGPDGGSLRQTRELIALHSLQKQVAVCGFTSDVAAMWRDHHALVLPSRFEGNPLALTEAMLCGRTPIVTNIGRAAELVDDNRHGFLAAAATSELLDDAMERAWQRRHEWQLMGALAAAAIRQRHSLRPAEDFAEAILATAAGEQRLALRAAA
jgi:glycosyltransferase involved in cell wall biosynthesis